MANKAASMTIAADGIAVATWVALTENDTGLPVNMARFPDRTVQVTGDFTTSGAVTIEGSNNGVDYNTLTDHTGAALVITTTVPRVIVENPLYIRPRATAGTAVAMVVTIVGVHG